METKIDYSVLPSLPGCYLYKDVLGQIIYVGKAKNLKKRVSSYFTKKNLDAKTKALVTNANSVDFLITNSELEAFLLEDSLIKKHKPKYNIDLKDSKSYAFIQITNEDFPRLTIARSDIYKSNKEKGKVFGPFVSTDFRNQTIELLNKVFKLRTCKRLPKKKCLRYDLGLCSAPCIKKISKEAYNKTIQDAEYILKGKDRDFAKKLLLEMKNYSNNKDYEKALHVRNKIQAINFLREKQNVERQKTFDEDIINFVVKEDKVYLMVFNIYKGTLTNKQEFILDFRQEFFEEFLTRFYSENSVPKEIIVPKKISLGLEEYISNKKRKKVAVKIPKKGELKMLLELVKKNIEIIFFGEIQKLVELKKILNLQEDPIVIECFDISHLSGTNVVASMVQFKNGVPNKESYRKFKIKSFQGNDDFLAMREVIKRRYSRLLKENASFPNLIVIDGGLGQLHSAMESLKELNIKIPIISLAKKFEEIYFPGKNLPLQLPEKNKARLFLQSIRDEAHRFAIKFQRERRKKSYFE